MERKKKIAIGIGLIFILSIISYYAFSTWQRRNEPLTIYGNVDIRDVNLSFRVSGRLLELKVDEGDTVRRGDYVGRLDPEPYNRAIHADEATVGQQKAALAYAQTVLEREKRLYGTGASTVDRYNNAVSSQTQAQASLEKAKAVLSESRLNLQDTYLYAPSDGVVLTRVVEPGTVLPVSGTVITVSLINPVWVRAYISETDLGRAKPGVHVKVYADSFANKAFDGTVGFVSDTAEFTPKTVETVDLRTELVYRLRIVINDEQHELRQGMPVTVRFVDSGPSTS